MADRRDGRENEKTSRRGSGKRKLLFLIPAGVLLLLGLAGFFVWLGFYTYVHPIDMNDYVSVVFRGYDEAGSVRVTVDRDAFLRDWSGKLRWKDHADRERGDAAEALIREITAEIAGSEDNATEILKNGDDLRVRWRNRSFRTRIANAEISAESFHVTVEGLEEPEEFDAFAALELVCEGLDGEGRVVKTVEHSGLKYKYDLTYTFDAPGENTLRNGDLIMVSVGDREKELELIRTYGVKPKEMKKEIPVTGLLTYTTFDPFTDVRLVFSGRNGEGVLEKVENASALEASQKLIFTAEPAKGLRNGDKVLVKVVLGQVKREEMARDYGLLPDPLEKTFVVSGLPEKDGPDSGGDDKPGGDDDPGGDQPDETDKLAFGKVDGNMYTNEFFNLKASFPAGFTVYGKDNMPSGILGGLNDLYATAATEDNAGVRVQRLTEAEKGQSAEEILMSYADEIFSLYRSYGASTTHKVYETTFAGETFTCLDITAQWKVIVVVKEIRHRIYVRKQGDYAVAVSVMASSESKLNEYCGYFKALK